MVAADATAFKALCCAACSSNLESHSVGDLPVGALSLVGAVAAAAGAAAAIAPLACAGAAAGATGGVRAFPTAAGGPAGAAVAPPSPTAGVAVPFAPVVHCCDVAGKDPVPVSADDRVLDCCSAICTSRTWSFSCAVDLPLGACECSHMPPPNVTAVGYGT